MTAIHLRPPAVLATAHEAVKNRAPKALPLLGPPFGALVAGWILIASRAPKGWASVFNPATFNHWDADKYLSIAEHGYRASAQCRTTPAFPNCGNVTWFPGYPGVIRVLASTHIGYPAAALVVAWICWYLTLLMVWVLSADGADRADMATRGGTARRIACLALAAVFPGQVYFAALFPISLLTFVLLLCIWCATRTSFATRASAVRTGVLGVVAGLTYPLALAAAPALVVGAFVTHRRHARIAMFTGAAAIVAGFGLVLAYAQLRVGLWNAYFITEEHEYGVKAHSPLTLLDRRYHQFVHPPSSWFRITTQQGALATLLVALALALTLPGLIRARRAADLTDLALLGTACIAWIVPYVGAGGLSIYRSEACLIVLVPLLRRLLAVEIAALACAAAVVAYHMAPLFFSNALI
jgi:putative Ca2+/H+ antiporter (TMEM165/GDT1 family)